MVLNINEAFLSSVRKRVEGHALMMRRPSYLFLSFKSEVMRSISLLSASMQLTLFCSKAKTDRAKAALCQEVRHLNAKLDMQSKQLAEKDLEILTLRLAASMEKRA